MPTPQRRTHKSMTGEMILNKLSKKEVKKK
jgi:hypothetical protein